MTKVPMLELVKTPNAKRIWRICRTFGILPTDPRISALNEFDIQFIECSLIAENPKLLKQLEETYYDPEFESFWENPDNHDL